MLAFAFINIGSVFIEIGEFSRAKRYINDALKIAIAIGAKNIEINCYIHLCRINIMIKNYVTGIDYYKQGIAIAKKIGLKRELLRLLVLVSEIHYHKRKYLKGVKIANQSIKIAKKMGTKDLQAETLLIKAKNGSAGILSKAEIFRILKETIKVAEEIGCPEILWRVYFEYGRFLRENKEYRKGLKYYRKCITIFRDVVSKIKNESYKKSYLNRSDRKSAFNIINET